MRVSDLSGHSTAERSSLTKLLIDAGAGGRGMAMDNLFDGGAIREVALEETEHWRVTRDFLRDPERILAALLEE